MDSKKRTLRRLGIAGVATVTATIGLPALAGASTVTPNAPTGLTATDASAGTINLSWAAPTSGPKPAGYEIFDANSAGAEKLTGTPVNGNVLVKGTSYSVPKLATTGSYFFEVEAVNASGASGPSNEASAKAAAIVNSAPTGLSVTPGYQSATLSWNAPTTGDTPTTYTINYGTSATSLTSTQTVSPVNGTLPTTALVQGLSGANVYYFDVVANNDSNTASPASAVVSANVSNMVAPATPTMSAPTVSGSKVDLSWSADTGSAIGGGSNLVYYVYSGTASGAETLVGSTASTTYSFTGLSNGKYYYYVKAGTSAGISSASNEVSATVNVVVPPSPTGLTATAGYQNVQLSWTAPTGTTPTSYTVLESTSATGTYTAVAAGQITFPTATTAVVTGLTDGTPYYFKVLANTNGTPSNPTTDVAATPTTTKPGTPMGLTGYTNSGGTAVTLDFTPVPGSASDTYNVYEDGSSTPLPASDVTQGTGSVTVNTGSPAIASGFTYSFAVSATNPDGTSAPTSPITIVSGQTVPSAPTGLTATATSGTDDSVTLNWNAPTDQGTSAVSGYTVNYGTSASSLTSTASATGTTTAITGLTPGTKYYFDVTATNTTGPSAASSVVSATPQSAPTVAPTVTAAAGNGSATLTIAPIATTAAATGGSAVTGYDVFVGTKPGAESSTPVNSSPVSGTYTVTGLTNGTPYYFTVAAVNANGTGPASTETSATPTPTVPGAPTGLTASVNGLTTDLSWTAPKSDGGSPLTGYEVFESAGGSNPVEISGPSPIMGTSAVVAGLNSGTTYNYTVEAVNLQGNGSDSNVASATFGVAPTAPSAASGLQATTTGAGKASVVWSAPSNDGGSVVTGYLVTAHLEGGKGKTIHVTGTNAVVTGLKTGTYYFTVVAQNAVGNAKPSGPSNFIKMTAAATPQVKVYVTPPAMLQKAGVTIIRVTTNHPGVEVHLFDEAFGTKRFFQKKIMTTTAQSNGTGVAIFKIGIARTNKFFVVADGVKSNTVVARVK